MLTLTGTELIARPPGSKTPLVSLSYRNIRQAFYSRSKQPRWRERDGIETVARVDLGKMSFFRGERHWLILTTASKPVVLRFDEKQLAATLQLVEQRTGVKVRR